MKLCLDIGNSHLYGGLFDDNALQVRFRKIILRGASSDELGIFFREVMHENGHQPADITTIAF